MLTIKQLEQLEDVLRWGDMAANASGRIDDAIDIVKAEIARRKHGPFTLAEAIASGRPFRRKAWDDRKGWMREISDEYDAGQRLEFVKTDWGFGGCVEADDTTACDYELMQEGGE